MLKQDPTSAFKPKPAPTYFTCPDHVNASAPSGWTAVPPGMPFPFNIMLLGKWDGTTNHLTMDQTKYINCYYKGNSDMPGYDNTGIPTNLNNTPRLLMTLPGAANAYWSCVVDPTGSNRNRATCVPN